MADRFLLGIITALIVLGVIILSGVSAHFSQESIGNTTYFLFHQIKFGLIPGIFLALLIYKTPLKLIRKWVPVFLFINLILLGLVFIPGIGSHIYGASRWVNLGIIAFQPSEFLKLFFIVYLSAWLCNLNIKEKDVYKSLLPFLIIIGLISLFLIFQPDISTLGIIVFISVLMYFSVGTPLWHSALMILIGLSALAVLIKTSTYRFNRILALFSPKSDPMGISFQITQSLIAIGSGGIFGLGLGMSYQKFGFLPQAMSDTIFSVYAEETGLIGSIFLVMLFLLLFWRGYKIFKDKKKDQFSQLAALGICSWISFQAFIHIVSNLGIFPLTGVPLPFISYGGSHLLAEMMGIGLLLNISKDN